MEAVARMVSRRNGLVAALTEHGEFTVFQPLGGDVEVGDVIRGDLESLGSKTIINVTRGERIDVFIEDWSNDEATARQTLLG